MQENKARERQINELSRRLRQFEEEMGSTFSIEEWKELLQHAMDGVLSVRDEETKVVSALSIRTKNRPKRWPLYSGVVYAIPLPEHGGYGYAEMRIDHSEDKPQEYIQYFNLWTENRITLDELDAINPEPCITIVTGYYSILSSDWPILGRRFREKDTFKTPLVYGSVPDSSHRTSLEESYYIAEGIHGERSFVEQQEAEAVINPSGTSGDLAALYFYVKRLEQLGTVPFLGNIDKERDE